MDCSVVHSHSQVALDSFSVLELPYREAIAKVVAEDIDVCTHQVIVSQRDLDVIATIIVKVVFAIITKVFESDTRGVAAAKAAVHSDA